MATAQRALAPKSPRFNGQHEASVDLVHATDNLLKAKRAMGGLIELVLSASDDRKLSITRGNLYNLLEPIEDLLNSARDEVEAARAKLRSTAVEVVK